MGSHRFFRPSPLTTVATDAVLDHQGRLRKRLRPRFGEVPSPPPPSCGKAVVGGEKKMEEKFKKIERNTKVVLNFQVRDLL